MSTALIRLLQTDRTVISLVLIHHYMIQAADRMEQKSVGRGREAGERVSV